MHQKVTAESEAKSDPFPEDDQNYGNMEITSGDPGIKPVKCDLCGEQKAEIIRVENSQEVMSWCLRCLTVKMMEETY